MNKVFLVAMALVSCTTSSKINSAKQHGPTRIDSATAERTAYTYPSVYLNVGTVTVDTISKSH
jgi:hypothetical protein